MSKFKKRLAEVIQEAGEVCTGPTSARLMADLVADELIKLAKEEE